MNHIYFHEKQADGTCTIYASQGANKVVVETGVRPCNVMRRIDSLYARAGRRSIYGAPKR